MASRDVPDVLTSHPIDNVLIHIRDENEEVTMLLTV